MAKYELMLILSTSVTEEERNISLANVKKALEEASATIEKEDIW